MHRRPPAYIAIIVSPQGVTYIKTKQEEIVNNKANRRTEGATTKTILYNNKYRLEPNSEEVKTLLDNNRDIISKHIIIAHEVKPFDQNIIGKMDAQKVTMQFVGSQGGILNKKEMMEKFYKSIGKEIREHPEAAAIRQDENRLADMADQLRELDRKIAEISPANAVGAAGAPISNNGEAVLAGHHNVEAAVDEGEARAGAAALVNQANLPQNEAEADIMQAVLEPVDRIIHANAGDPPPNMANSAFLRAHNRVSRLAVAAANNPNPQNARRLANFAERNPNFVRIVAASVGFPNYVLGLLRRIPMPFPLRMLRPGRLAPPGVAYRQGPSLRSLATEVIAKPLLSYAGAGVAEAIIREVITQGPKGIYSEYLRPTAQKLKPSIVQVPDKASFNHGIVMNPFSEPGVNPNADIPTYYSQPKIHRNYDWKTVPKAVKYAAIDPVVAGATYAKKTFEKYYYPTQGPTTAVEQQPLQATVPHIRKLNQPTNKKQSKSEL